MMLGDSIAGTCRTNFVQTNKNMELGTHYGSTQEHSPLRILGARKPSLKVWGQHDKRRAAPRYGASVRVASIHPPCCPARRAVRNSGPRHRLHDDAFRWCHGSARIPKRGSFCAKTETSQQRSAKDSSLRLLGDLSYIFDVHSFMNLVRAAPVIFCSFACFVLMNCGEHGRSSQKPTR